MKRILFELAQLNLDETISNSLTDAINNYSDDQIEMLLMGMGLRLNECATLHHIEGQGFRVHESRSHPNHMYIERYANKIKYGQPKSDANERING